LSFMLISWMSVLQKTQFDLGAFSRPKFPAVVLSVSSGSEAFSFRWVDNGIH
jgi:hypothetical protein